MTANINRGCAGNSAARPESMTDKVRQFFITNPDEELSYEDFIVKWGCTREQVNHVRRRLLAEGLIETVTITRAVVSKTRRRDQ